MTNRPTFPIILVDNKSDYLDLVDNGDILTNFNVLGLIKGSYKNVKAYDKDGHLWKIDKVDSNYKLNGITKFLAYSVYNPKIKVAISWMKIVDYKLDELKSDISMQVDRDDDIITQFVNGEFIKHKIEKCDSFGDIVKTLDKYVFKVNEEEIWKEKESPK